MEDLPKRLRIRGRSMKLTKHQEKCIAAWASAKQVSLQEYLQHIHKGGKK